MFVNGRERERERVRGRCKYDLRTHRVRVYERVQVWMGIYERESVCVSAIWYMSVAIALSKMCARMREEWRQCVSDK